MRGTIDLRSLFFVLILTFNVVYVQSQINIRNDTVLAKPSTDSLLTLPKYPFRAGATIFSTNVGVWAFDRYVTKGEFAKISLNSVRNNLKTGFVWDNDMFATNLFAHPYHGGLYYNAARSNGMSFWQSIPYAAGGSLMWEIAMENEPPAINDFMATTIGGTCLGEMTFRISDLLINDRAVGFERFGREFLLTLVSPIRGINRILSGDSKRVRNIRGNSIPKPPTVFYLSLGHRIIADNLKHANDIINSGSFDAALYYGDSFSEENEKPYDFFMFKVGGNFLTSQPIISRVNALGLLYSVDLPTKWLRNRFIFGIFQHFNYYESNAVIDKVSIKPYKISEAASVGPGILYKRNLAKNVGLYASLHVSAILLGGSQTDHYQFDKRDYNMGSGFSTKLSCDLRFGSKAHLFFVSEDYRIYSWVGKQTADPTAINSNSQGDIGNASLTVVRLGFNYIIKKHFLISTETSYNYRLSHYKYYPTVEHHVEENKISLGYIF